LLAETANDLQTQLDAFYEYCNLWKLKVNADKTKVMVFGNGRLPQNLSFSYDNLNLEIVKNFNYLGIIFTRTGNFSLTKKHLADKENNEKRKGDRFSPCLTPFARSKYSDIQLLYEIQDFILSYILIITLYINWMLFMNIVICGN
jgi:competence CoiA-like predicted nuclease